MRIGFFTDTYYPSVHGVATSINQYKAALEQLGHTVFVITPEHPDRPPDEDKSVIRLKSFNPLIVQDNRAVLLYPGRAKSLGRLKLDVVHSHTPLGMGILADSVARQEHIPHVHTVHTIYTELASHYPTAFITTTALASLIYPLYFRTIHRVKFTNLPDESTSINLVKKQSWNMMMMFINHTDGVITPSQHLGQSIKAHGLHKPIFVLPNGINMQQFSQPRTSSEQPTKLRSKPADLFRIVTVGRLSEEKRQAEIIKGLAQLPQNLNWQLVVVGDGPMRREYTELTEKLGYSDRVVFCGSQPPNAVSAIMQHSDLFILASHKFDNQPMVILEAIANGLPILYCDSNLTEGLSENNALITKPAAASIGKGIAELAADAPRRASMHQAAVKLSSEFEITSLAAKLIGIYESLS